MPTVSVFIENQVDSTSCKSGETKTFTVNEGEVIFDALDNQGHRLPAGCLAGSCGTCRLEILDGADNLNPPSTIEQDTIDAIKKEYDPEFIKDKVIRLSCRAKVKGDVSLKPLKRK